MPPKELDEYLDSISTSEELAAFVDALRADFLNHQDEWQNIDLESALEAMAAWLRDSEGAANSHGGSLARMKSLDLCARLLLAAKTYE